MNSRKDAGDVLQDTLVQCYAQGWQGLIVL